MTRAQVKPRAHPARGVQGAGHPRPPVGEGAAADGREGHRRHGPHRQGPARASDRRPRQRQGIPGHGRDHQPEGQGRDLRLRRRRPEGLDGGRHRGGAALARRHGAHHHRGRHGRRARRPAVHRPLRGVRHGRVLHVRGAQGHARSSTTTSRGRPTRTASSPCSSAGRPAARRTRATCSTCTRACWSARRASPRRWAAAPSPRCP